MIMSARKIQKYRGYSTRKIGTITASFEEIIITIYARPQKVTEPGVWKDTLSLLACYIRYKGSMDTARKLVNVESKSQNLCKVLYLAIH